MMVSVIMKIIKNDQVRIICEMGGFEKSRLIVKKAGVQSKSLFAAGVLGHSLCSLRDGMLGELSWQPEAN